MGLKNKRFDRTKRSNRNKESLFKSRRSKFIPNYWIINFWLKFFDPLETLKTSNQNQIPNFLQIWHWLLFCH